LGIVVLNILITVRLLMTINVFLRVTTITWSLFHHDHLFRFSATLLYNVLHVGGPICSTSCHLLNIVADGVKGSLGASLRHDWGKTTVLSRVNIRGSR
jgi:hypothetical protein